MVFDVVEMHKNIGAAIIRQDEAKPAIYVERTSPGQLAFLVAFHPIAAPPGHAAAPPSSVMNSSLQDGAENAMSIRIGYLLPTQERIMAGQPQAAPLLELAERAERVSVPSRCPSWRASPSARRRVAAAGSRPARAAACRRRSPDGR